MKKDILYINSLDDIKIINMMRTDCKSKTPPYNPHNLKHKYLTTEITYTGSPIEVSITTDGYYSLDYAKTWNHINADEIVELNENATILWRDFTEIDGGYGTFSISESFDVSGNVMSLVNGSIFPKLNKIPNDNTFEALFANSNIHSAKDLILPTILTLNCFSCMFIDSQLSIPPQLPATVLADTCYGSMFQGTLIEESPILPAVHISDTADSCYVNMFKNCSNLRKITAYFTRNPGGTMLFTEDWVKGVANSGTFVKNRSASWNLEGNNGIPLNWNVETVTVN